MLVDFIKQTKLPAVLLAKALENKDHFNSLLRENEEFKKSLVDIGYTIKLHSETKKDLTAEFTEETQKIQHIKQIILHRADIFSQLLTSSLKKLATKSSHDAEIIYNLSQIIFLWDEFTDFADYQKTGDVATIRESVFYKAATEIIQKMTDEEFTKLETLDFQTQSFEKALYKLQIKNGETRFTSDLQYVVIQALESEQLKNPELVYFLTIVESALFIQIAEELVSKAQKGQVSVFQNISDVQVGINKVQEIFQLNADQLEEMIEEKAKIIMLQLTIDTFI